MKINTITVIAASLAFSSSIVAEAVAVLPVEAALLQPQEMPEPDVLPGDVHDLNLQGLDLHKRQGVGVVGGVVGGADVTATDAGQLPALTTQWLPEGTTINGVKYTTYVQIIFSQSFAAVPDQLPSPGSGAIGYGTLQKSKRDVPQTAEAWPTGGIAGRVKL